MFLALGAEYINRPCKWKFVVFQNFEYFDPWGKGQGNPRRGNDGYVERFQSIKQIGIVPPAKDAKMEFNTVSIT